MSRTYCPCPRPILKRPSPHPIQQQQQDRDDSAQLLNIDPSILQPLVRFQTHTALTHTFYAHSPNVYDRSPIVVSPNKCSLPERGCPGKTYFPTDTSVSRAFASRSGRLPNEHSPAGRHLHPRAVRVQIPSAADEEDAERTPRATPVVNAHPLPALVPDLSSSESEESDGFCSPPLESASMNCYASPKPSTSSPPAHHHGWATALSIPIPPAVQDISTDEFLASVTISNATSPLSFRSRTLTANITRSSSPARSRSPPSSRSHSPCRDAPSTSPTRKVSKPKSRRSSRAGASPSEVEARYKSFSERSMLSSCSLNVPDVGCFGGF